MTTSPNSVPKKTSNKRWHGFVGWSSDFTYRERSNPGSNLPSTRGSSVTEESRSQRQGQEGSFHNEHTNPLLMSTWWACQWRKLPKKIEHTIFKYVPWNERGGGRDWTGMPTTGGAELGGKSVRFGGGQKRGSGGF